MATSGTYTYNSSRDTIIARALRIAGAYGQGETPETAAINEAAVALEHMLKEWQADGMQLWTQTEYTMTPVLSTPSYTVGVGSAINQVAPLKVLQAWYRRTADSIDTPLKLITRDEYNRFQSKAQNGTPTQLYYSPPGPIIATDLQGTVYLYSPPDSNFAASYTVKFLGTRPLQDAGGSSATLDFPQEFQNAIVFNLADLLAYEYHLEPAERSMISKKALYHYDKAMSFGTEEGSLYLVPEPNWSEHHR